MVRDMSYQSTFLSEGTQSRDGLLDLLGLHMEGLELMDELKAAVTSVGRRLDELRDSLVSDVQDSLLDLLQVMDARIGGGWWELASEGADRLEGALRRGGLLAQLELDLRLDLLEFAMK